MFFMKKFSENNPVKGYMIMEFLENIKGVHIFENVKPKQVRQVRMLATFGILSEFRKHSVVAEIDLGLITFQSFTVVLSST